MLDASGRFEVDDIAVFPDGTLQGGYYAVSLSPRLASDEDGRPTISLAVFGQQSAGAFATSGAVLTLTTELAVPHSQLSRLQQILAARLADVGPRDAVDAAPTPQLLVPEWVEASVEVRLTSDLTLTGIPSMTSQNRCSFSSKLTADGATALVTAWRAGLPDAQITYVGRLRSGGGRRVTEVSSGRTSSSHTTTTSTTRTTTTHTSSSSTSLSSWSRSSEFSGGDDEPNVHHTERHATTTWTSGDAPRGAGPEAGPSPAAGGVPRAPDPGAGQGNGSIPGGEGLGAGGPRDADAASTAQARPDADRIVAIAKLRDSLPDPSSSLLITEL